MALLIAAAVGFIVNEATQSRKKPYNINYSRRFQKEHALLEMDDEDEISRTVPIDSRLKRRYTVVDSVQIE